MADNTVVLSGLTAYAGQRSQQLILQMLMGMSCLQDMTLISNVKSKLLLNKLTVASRMRPYSSTFSATDSGANFSDRTLETQLGKGEWLVDVQDFRGTWLEEQMQAGVAQPTKEALPFAAQFWNQAMLANGTDLNLHAIWNGKYNKAGTSAKDIFDGFGTILAKDILDGKITANVTGAITADNAVAQIETLYRRFDSKYRTMTQNVYMSYGTYDKYCDNYRERFKQTYLPENFLQKSIDASGGKVFLKPVDWLGDSGRVLITPKENLLIGTDRLSDMNTIRTQPDMWVLKCGIAVNIGVQFRDHEVMQVNDQV